MTEFRVGNLTSNIQQTIRRVLFCYRPINLISILISAPHCKVQNLSDPKTFAYEQNVQIENTGHTYIILYNMFDQFNNQIFSCFPLPSFLIYTYTYSIASFVI